MPVDAVAVCNECGKAKHNPNCKTCVEHASKRGLSICDHCGFAEPNRACDFCSPGDPPPKGLLGTGTQIDTNPPGSQPISVGPRCSDHRNRIDLQARELCNVQVRLDVAISRETALRSDGLRLREQLARTESEMGDAIKMGQSMSTQLKAAMVELEALKALQEKHRPRVYLRAPDARAKD